MSSVKRILITGGAGFLGSHLTKALLEAGHVVTVLDNLYTGRLENITPLQKQFGDALLFRKEDVRNMSFDQEIDEIYNLACPASPPHYQRNPIATTETCFFGALNTLNLARKYNAKVLQASTSEVYGDAKVHPQPESYWGNVNPDGPRSCYDEGKRVAESLFFDHRRMYGTRIKIARIFNSYGPNMDPNDGRVVSNFIMQALRGMPITIYGKGEQTRSFCYCQDTIKGLIALMESKDETTGPINIGNPGEFTILELAEKILAMTQSASELVHAPLPPNDPQVRRPDITLARSVLNWNPTIPLHDGLLSTIQYFKKLL